MKEKIKDYLLQKIKEKSVIGYDDDIFQLGFVNSMFALQLVMYIEKEFGIEVSNEDLDIKNFNTVNHIAAFVESKKI